MKINKKEEQENPLQNRKKVKLRITEYEETPSRKTLTDKIAAELNHDKDKLVIDKIKQQYGKKEAECTVKIYDSKEAKEKHTPKHLEKRNKEEEE